MTRPTIDRAIEVLPGTDVADAWDRFEVFEALHHSLSICNPMSSEQLDELVTAIDLADGQCLLDVACGSGEFLVRTAETAAIEGVGVDLSPWMITAAHSRAQRRVPEANLRWVLGEARDFRTRCAPHAALCLGAEWIWHDFGGTVRALSDRVIGGGVICIGAARLHHDADQVQITEQRGFVETVDDMHQTLVDHGLKPVHRIDPDDTGWDTYLARTATAAAQWAKQRPGDRAEHWVAEQEDWQQARERDRDVIGWSVWVARKR